MRSIRRRLLAKLLSVGALLCVLMACAVALLARAQVGELLDYQLEQIARVLIDHDLSALAAQRPDDPAMHLEIRIGDESARLLYASSPDLGLPFTTPLGLTTIADPSGADDDGYRVFTLRSDRRIVQVMQPVSLRDDLAWEAGVAALVPSIIVLAALSMLIFVTIRRELAPLQQLSGELEARSAEDLASIRLANAPAELQAPVLTLNRLLSRLEEAIRAHKEFVADAAHELRSPLAAIRIQAGNVAAAKSDVEREGAVVQLMRGVDRASHLVQQLLTLARLEPSARPKPRERVDLRSIAEHCLVDHVGTAAAKNMQLGLDASDAIWVNGDGPALRIMIDNLVENAIKYAPQSTPVDLALTVQDGQAVLHVRDHGVGIPQAERERVFDRFHRLDHPEIPGSGLGLAIVAAVVRAHDGAVSLRDPPHGAGQLVEVRLPAAMEPASVPQADGVQ